MGGCSRALKVLTDNILAPDDITKRSIQVVAEDHEKVSDSKTETTISRVKQIKNVIDLEDQSELEIQQEIESYIITEGIGKHLNHFTDQYTSVNNCL